MFYVLGAAPTRGSSMTSWATTGQAWIELPDLKDPERLARL